MKTDIEIALSVKLKHIEDIAGRMHIPSRHIISYGRYIAKINSALLKDPARGKDGKLILVTSMSPTPAGEGKTTITIGLAQSLRLLNKKVIACIRQPSLGPFFGAKGGATGSGQSQVLPVEDITMHFTGDDHAVVSAHNLIASIVDNHLYHGNKLRINPDRILWKRVSDINDRALRKVKVGFEGKIERIDEFHISAASEIMSILCLSQNLMDLKQRVENILVAFDNNSRPVFVKDLKIQGAVTALLRNAIHPNIVQSVEGAPVFVHGGPFGNVSLGCSSLIATKTALRLADYVITEAGFATELGAEKFFDIKCRVGGLHPSLAVIVATLNALRLHGGAKDYKNNPPTHPSDGFPALFNKGGQKGDFINGGQGKFSGEKKDTAFAINGLKNLEKHIENIRKFGIPLLVAINRYEKDTDEELNEIINLLENKDIPAFVTDVRNKGGKGGIDIAEKTIELCRQKNKFHYLYPLDMSVEEKIITIAKEMYGADKVIFSKEAKDDIKVLEDIGYKNLPVCIAKTPHSLSDNPSLVGRPDSFDITVQRVMPAVGAGFLVALCGKILLMPGFPEHPIAERIDVDDEGILKFLP